MGRPMGRDGPTLFWKFFWDTMSWRSFYDILRGEWSGFPLKLIVLTQIKSFDRQNAFSKIWSVCRVIWQNNFEKRFWLLKGFIYVKTISFNGNTDHSPRRISWKNCVSSFCLRKIFKTTSAHLGPWAGPSGALFRSCSFDLGARTFRAIYHYLFSPWADHLKLGRGLGQ